MILIVLANIIKYGTCAFFQTCFVAEFKWVEIIQVVLVNNYLLIRFRTSIGMKKLKYLKRNIVTPVRQIDYTFRQLLNKVILGGMHPTGQPLNYDEKREFQTRETAYTCPNSRC